MQLAGGSRQPLQLGSKHWALLDDTERLRHGDGAKEYRWQLTVGRSQRPEVRGQRAKG